MAKYDPNALKARLASLPPLALVALAAACAERANHALSQGHFRVELHDRLDRIGATLVRQVVA